MAAFDQHDARTHILAYCTVILFSILLIFSGFYAQDQKARTIQVEDEVQTDLRARDVNHLIDAIPKCVTNCIFPTILDKGCAHSDYKCICENLRALDDSTPVVEDPCLVPRSDEPQDEEKDGSFRVCVEDCSLLEQLRAPAIVYNLCYNMDVPFKLPEIMVQMAKRGGAISSGIPVFSQSIAPILVPTTTPTTTSLGHSSTITLAETSSSTSTSTTAKNTFPTFSIPTSTTSTGSGSVVSPSNSSSPKISSNSGLSSSAKIAIGVAIPLVVIVLAVAAFWYFRHRHRKNRPPVMENEVHDGGLPEVTTISDIKRPGQVKYSEAKEGRAPVEAGGVPIAEMGDIREAARRPSAFELHNQSSTPQLDSRPVLGGVDRGPRNPRTSPVNAAVTRKAVSPPLNPAGNSSSAFPAPWETDPSAMEFHAPQIPLGRPPPQSPPQSPQVSLPTGQVTARQSVSAMGATGSGDAELLRQELELARVREREAELLRNIAERRRMGGGGGPA